MTARIVYLHGFNSSPQSFKAQLVAQALAARGRGAGYACPLLPPDPVAAVRAAAEAIERLGATALVGSSLGGYYATHLAERCGLAAVLVNPAVRPYALLAEHVGLQRNFHTGEQYELTRDTVTALHKYEHATITHPERYLLLVTTGDEVLDYRAAVERYRGAAHTIVAGGDHAFTSFDRYLDKAIAFCDAASEQHENLRTPSSG